MYQTLKLLKMEVGIFGWLKKSKLIKKELESYAHSEHNTKELKNIKSIDFCIKNKINFFDYNEKLFC